MSKKIFSDLAELITKIKEKYPEQLKHNNTAITALKILSEFIRVNILNNKNKKITNKTINTILKNSIWQDSGANWLTKITGKKNMDLIKFLNIINNEAITNPAFYSNKEKIKILNHELNKINKTMAKDNLPSNYVNHLIKNSFIKVNNKDKNLTQLIKSIHQPQGATIKVSENFTNATTYNNLTPQEIKTVLNSWNYNFKKYLLQVSNTKKKITKLQKTILHANKKLQIYDELVTQKGNYSAAANKEFLKIINEKQKEASKIKDKANKKIETIKTKFDHKQRLFNDSRHYINQKTGQVTQVENVAMIENTTMGVKVKFDVNSDFVISSFYFDPREVKKYLCQFKSVYSYLNELNRQIDPIYDMFYFSFSETGDKITAKYYWAAKTNTAIDDYNTQEFYNFLKKFKFESCQYEN